MSTEISDDEKERTAAMIVFDTLLSCTKDNIAMMMLFFTLIISMLTSVFKRSGIARIPQYVLGVIGVIGSGKTTLVKALLSFIKDYSYFDLSVGYTEAAFRKILSSIAIPSCWLTTLLTITALKLLIISS